VIACASCGADNESTAHVCVACAAPLDNPAARALLGRTVLGVYELIDVIGKGGMSVVYRARHRMTEQVVALKILPAELAIHADIKARFVEEAKALARLEHPSIVRLYNFGEEGGRFVLAMQYVEGTTFERRILAAGRLPWRDAVEVIVQVLIALDYAHDRGIVHRDIKPSNILVRPDGSAMVMDFGIAKMGEDSAKLTATGQTMGTVRYMSPEQVRGHVLDRRSDLYSVGATLYEALVGDTPFDGPTHFEIMMKHLNEPPPTARDRGAADVPAALDVILQRALAKDKTERHQTAAELLGDLEALLDPDDASLRHRLRREPPTPLPQAAAAADDRITGIAKLLEPDEPRPPPALRPRLAAGAALGAVLVGASAAVLLLLGQRGGGAPVPQPFLAAGFTPVVDRWFEQPERVRVLAARDLDAARVAAAYAAARRRFAAYALEKAGVEVEEPPVSVVIAPAAVLCTPELQPAGVPEDCLARPPHFVYPPRRATLYVLDDPDLETVHLVEGTSAHLCINTPALLERRCMLNFLPPYWDEIERTR
jgi:serine/threonine protein kinase